MLNNIKNIVLIASGIAFIYSCIIMKNACSYVNAMVTDDSDSFDEHVSEALHIVK